jgi:NAD(P) transhydrogenase subunit alpha
VIISALKSNNSTDNRSPIHKETISTLINLGIEIWFEDNIGEGVNTSNEIFQELGLKKHSRNECLENSDLVITNQSLTKEEVELMKKNATILGMVNPFSNQDLIETCYKSNINLVSMEFIPRITRAQKMDVLSSQANLAGYVAVIEAAKHLSTCITNDDDLLQEL